MVEHTISIANGGDEPLKKLRHTTMANLEKAKLSSDDVISLLKTHDAGVLRQGLITLKSQLFFSIEEYTVQPQDERLVFSKSWLEKSPSAEGLLKILQVSEKNPAIIQLCFGIFANLLNLLSTHFVYHPYGAAILKTLLSQQNLDILNSNISDGSQDVITSALDLFNSMSSFAGGVEKRAVMDGFTWGQKTRQKLFFLRRKVKYRTTEDLTNKPDIRTLYIKFILSFLTKSTPTSIKVTFLEQHKDIFLSIFKGIDQDSYHIIRYILETCWDGIWNDNKLKRTMKIALFQERTLAHLFKLYDRKAPEDDEGENIPADVVHHFFLGIMTRPGFGVCFHDRGWYPKDEVESASNDIEHQEDDTEQRSRGKMYNKILSNILKLLKVNEDSRQQELAFKILQACPELVSGYWNSINLTLEPRLSSRWITNISILGHIISFPIPIESFTLPTSGYINPTAPPLQSCMSNILPTVFSRTYISKGLQSTSILVKHCTALALIKCFIKLGRVMSVFHKNSSVLEEDEALGQWIKRAYDLQREMEGRVPDVMVIIGMIQHSQKTNNPSSILLGECAVRLLGLYQTLFPRLFSEIKFESGKLLENALELHQNSVPGHYNVLYQLRILRFLTDNDQFSGMNKMGSARSQLYGILLLHAKSENLAICDVTAALCSKILSQSILFMHDPEELDLWLQAIPRARTSDNAGTPDEVVAVLAFLDDCIQRCSKTPYKYIEELRIFFKREDMDDVVLPSPLLITALEQLEAKIAAGLLSPFDTLALITFMRKLAIGLSTKFPSLRGTRTIQQKLIELVSKSMTPGTAESRVAIQRECALISNIIGFIENPSHQSNHTGELVVEHDPPISDSSWSLHKAYDLLDRLRFNLLTPSREDIKQTFETMFKFHPPSCAEFLYHIDPTLHGLHDCIRTNKAVLNVLPFELCDIHLNTNDVLSEDIHRLVACFYSGRSWNRSFIRRLAITLHRLNISGSNKSDDRLSRVSLLNFIREILAYGIKQNVVDINAVSEALFVESEVMRALCCSTTLTNAETRALHNLIQVIVDPVNSDSRSRETIKSYCIFWANLIKDTNDMAICLQASPWIPYMDPPVLIRFLDLVFQSTGIDVDACVVESILSSLARQLDSCYVVEQLQSRVEDLLYLPCQSVVDRLILAILEAALPVGYNGHIAYLNSNTNLAVSFAVMSEHSRKKWIQKGKDKRNFEFQFSKLLEDIDRNGAAISVCFYKYASTRSLFKNWLKRNTPPPKPSDGLIVCLYGFLDSGLTQENCDVEVFRPWAKSLIELVFNQSSPHRLQSLCAETIKLLVQYKASYVSWLVENARFVGHHPINLEVIQVITAFKISTVFGDTITEESFEHFLKLTLEWLSSLFISEELSESTKSNISLLIPILKDCKFKASQVEAVIKSAIRNHLGIPSVLDVSTILLQCTDFKPMIINQLLQSIVQHSRLYNISDIDSLTNLLHALFHQYPVNTSQPSHIIPLLRLYRGTMSKSDYRLVSIFQLYEKQTKHSIASLFCHWSASQLPTSSQSIVTAVLSLDSNKVFRTCCSYPKTRCSNGKLLEESFSNQELYDPLFLMSMASQIILAKEDVSVSDWVQIFRTNIFSVTISALSSKDHNMREMSVAILAGLQRRLQETLIIETNQVLYILDMLKNTVSREDIVPRLPTFVVLFLAYALHCIFYPSSFLYPMTSRFLLQRPEFDITDVPLLYSLLYSASDSEWVKERTWIIRYLTQVVDSGELADWKVLRRRHTWDLVASMWQASKSNERSLRKGILEFIATMTTNQFALPSLVLRSHVLCWVEMQLTSDVSAANELLAWLKIIENIMVFMDFRKAEERLDGTYSISIIRCVRHVSRCIPQLDNKENYNLSLKLDLIYLASRILLRISERELTQSCHASIMATVENLVKLVFSLESSLNWPGNDIPPYDQASGAQVMSLPPHKATGLFAVPNFDETKLHTDTHLKVWTYIVVLLWRVTMASADSRHILWDHLTHRCLAIHSIAITPSDSTEGIILNWIRRKTLECIVHQ